MGADDQENNKIADPQSLLAEELLAKGEIESVDWNKSDPRGFTILHCLLSVKATPEREEQILQLLSKTTNVFSLVHWHEDNTTPSSITPLYLAIIGGYYQVWPYLLQKGANVNQPSLPYGDDDNKLPQYPFWVACNLKDSCLTYTIIQNIMGMFDYGVSPFTCLKEEDWASFCSLFERKECTPLYPKLLGLVSIETLLTKDMENKALVADGFGREKVGWLAMLCAVRNSNYAGIEALLKKGVPVVWPEKHTSFLDIYFSPRGAATMVPDVVRILVENGCNPSVKPQFGDVTALMKCINSKNTDCLRSMLQGGKKLPSFNIDVKNERGQTPLYSACHKESPYKPVIEVLLIYGADPNIASGLKDYSMELPLVHCFFNNKLDIALLLLDAGATLDNMKFSLFLEYGLQYPDNELLHAVIVAAACAMRGIVESTAASLNKVRSTPFNIREFNLLQYGTSFLHIACSHGNKSTVIYLLQQNLDINAKNYCGNLALHTALMCCNEDIALFLLNNGTDCVPSGDGIDCLSMACLQDLPEAALWIAKKSGKLRSIINVGFTSLLACEYVCNEYVRWVIDNCRRSGATSFLDAEFPPTDASLWENPSAPPPADIIEHPDHWKPVKRMSFQPSLFGKEISLVNIEQGSIGTCYLLGALALLTTRPELLQDMFVVYDMELGIFGIRFFNKGRWAFVVVDGMIPCNNKGKPVYGCSKDNTQIYVMILEKAYAKLKGSYESIDREVGRFTMVDLTGGVCKQMKFDLDETAMREAIHTRSIWKILQDHHRQGRLMSCQIEKNYFSSLPLPNGLLINHSYGILSLAKVEKQHLIQLHNPHKKGVWTGDWSENSSMWAKYPAVESALKANKPGEREGIFWISYEDFIQNFNSVDVTHIVYSPKTKHNVGFTQHKNVDIAKGKAFAISSANAPMQVAIEIRQHINDFLNRDALSGEELMLMVCTFDRESYTTSATDPKSISLHSDLRTARMVERVLPTTDSKFALFFTMWHRNTPYFIVPLAMDKVSHLTCDVGIHTDKPVEHLSVNMLVPFWGGIEMDMDERKKQELMKIKGRLQVARARARGVRVPSATSKHHSRNLSASNVTQASPLLFNNPLGLTRSLVHSQSHPVLSVPRTHSPRHTGNSPQIIVGPISPLSPHSPRIVLSPGSPNSPRARASSLNSISNNNNSTSTITSNTESRSPNAVRSSKSPHMHGSPSKRSPINTSSLSNLSKSPTRSPKSRLYHSNDVYYSKYKEKIKQMKNMVKVKDEELTQLKEQIGELLTGNKKPANLFDFIPPPIQK